MTNERPTTAILRNVYTGEPCGVGGYSDFATGANAYGASHDYEQSLFAIEDHDGNELTAFTVKDCDEEGPYLDALAREGYKLAEGQHVPIYGESATIVKV